MKIVKQLVLVAVIVIVVRFAKSHFGWHSPGLFASGIDRLDFDVEWNRVLPSVVLWIVFSVYWSIESRNSAPTHSSESKPSTVLHQLLLNVALILLIWPAPGMRGWFLPMRFHSLVAVGASIQAACIVLAVWARRHLGRNWSAEVRIAKDHELVRSGPYRILRHPIYTAMLGMFLGTAIASSQYHALVGVALLIVAYIRKTRLEEQILLQTFGTDYEAYRRDTWALAPLVY
jgi:protein-S-isoprenylcysteine O-methyltransferase Ste14